MGIWIDPMRADISEEFFLLKEEYNRLFLSPSKISIDWQNAEMHW